MLPFNPNDPYPLLAECSYAEAQAHAAVVDAWIGFQAEAIESSLTTGVQSRDHQTWIGLPIKSLLTPYTEIRSVLAKLNPQVGSTVVDLGAGYGRMGLVLGKHYLGVRFIGYELVPERVIESRRCLARFSYLNVTMEIADLSAKDFTPAKAEFYFLYDFGNRESIEKCLQDLRVIAKDQKITVVGRGRSSRDAIERQHPWLSQVEEAEHHGNYSIYRSGSTILPTREGA